jgi:hypothetical protein
MSFRLLTLKPDNYDLPAKAWTPKVRPLCQLLPMSKTEVYASRYSSRRDMSLKIEANPASIDRLSHD